MGNFLSTSSSPQDLKNHAFELGGDEAGIKNLPTDTGGSRPAAVIRPGSLGLFDMGFEYRMVQCKEHTGENHVGERRSICFQCATRLFHVKTGTMITATNRKGYIPDGPVFDQVSRICQEIVQERLQQEHSMEFVTLCNDEAHGVPVRALVSADFENSPTQQRPVFLCITGKGKSRAGVISVKEIMISGIEKGSTLFHLCQARKRGFSVVCLDPNALGEHNGMEVLDRSLTALFRAWERAAVYVLAHSASGGYLVRYLVVGTARIRFFSNIRAIVFTDSTHRVQWARDDPALFSFLQSPRCIYIRNNTALESGSLQAAADVAPGAEARVDVWWCQRFGELRTVWAGTTSHSAMCWVARDVIWTFFDGNTTHDTGRDRVGPNSSQLS